MGQATSAELFIEKWNIVQPLSAMQTKLRNLVMTKGTDYAKTNFLERLRDGVLDVFKRVRGSAGIINRIQDTHDGRSTYAEYATSTLDESLAKLKMAAEVDFEQAPDSSDEQQKRLEHLQHRTVETVMGQVGDPLEKLKDTALEKTKENFPLSMPKQQTIRQATVCHMGEPLGFGCSKAKLIYSPPR